MADEQPIVIKTIEVPITPTVPTPEPSKKLSLAKWGLALIALQVACGTAVSIFAPPSAPAVMGILQWSIPATAGLSGIYLGAQGLVDKAKLSQTPPQ